MYLSAHWLYAGMNIVTTFIKHSTLLQKKSLGFLCLCGRDSILSLPADAYPCWFYRLLACLYALHMSYGELNCRQIILSLFWSTLLICSLGGAAFHGGFFPKNLMCLVSVHCNGYNHRNGCSGIKWRQHLLWMKDINSLISLDYKCFGNIGNCWSVVIKNGYSPYAPEECCLRDLFMNLIISMQTIKPLRNHIMNNCLKLVVVHRSLVKIVLKSHIFPILNCWGIRMCI